MAQQPLPLIDPGRTESGFPRTVCACRDCVRNCLHIPGYLIPTDLHRLKEQCSPDADLHAWARQHLLASPGALVLRKGRIFRIPTLVPARRLDGACLFLTAQDRCRIHAVAPFGCAFFDAHQGAAEADQRSSAGLQSVLEAWRGGVLYAQIWIELHAAGRFAPAPEICRRLLREASANGAPP